MIEINLSPTKRSGALNAIGGFDFSLINVKMWIIAVIVLYVPEMLLESHFESSISAEQAVQTSLNKKLREVTSKVAGMANIEKQVQALNEQEAKLAKKLEVVKEIIGRRRNPYPVLKYVAENIPESVWIVSMDLKENELVMKGYSKSFKSIGSFLENLKSSIFFDKNSITYDRPADLPGEVNGVSLEIFQVKANIVSFQ